MSLEGETTTLVGPVATTIDVAERLDRMGFAERAYSNGGTEARLVLAGGYWPELEEVVRDFGWRVQPEQVANGQSPRLTRDLDALKQARDSLLSSGRGSRPFRERD